MISDLSSAPRSWRTRFFQGGLARLMAGVLAMALLMPEAQAKGYSSGRGKSYSSGSRSSSSSSTRSGGYSSGRSSYSSGGSRSPSSSRSSSSGYDSQAARARQQADSQRRYEGSKPPPIPSAGTTTSGSPGGGSSTSRSGSAIPPPIPSGRGYSSSGYSRGYGGGSPTNRRTFSTGAKAAMIGAAVLTPVLLSYASRPPVYYQDPYGSPFWYWLLDQPREVRADWLYHHQATVDPGRRAEMLRADPGLQAQVDALAAKKAPVQPNYVPAGLKNDDMFADPAADAEAEAANTVTTNSSEGGSTLFWITMLGGGAALAWLVFFKRWKPARHMAVPG